MVPECDNYKEVHNPVTIGEDHHALRIGCRICKRVYVIRKDENGNPEKRLYAKLFKRDILQPHENLFYKVYKDRAHIL